MPNSASKLLMQGYHTSGGGHGGLLEEILDRIRTAERRVWIKVPWWDHSTPQGREVLDTVASARQRGLDVRVLTRNEGPGIATIGALRRRNVPVKPFRYLHEKELITDESFFVHSMNFTWTELTRNTQSGVRVDETLPAAVKHFERAWNEHSTDVVEGQEHFSPTGSVLPPELMPFIRHRQLNPLQSKVLPVILATKRHSLVVAPTGAGKTTIGEVAALRAIKLEGKKAAWLVPARALANELGKDLRKHWERHGIKVEELTGESNLSSGRLSRADVWFATTEKFESLSRRGSLQRALSQIGCLIVDEVHLVGDETRGATLESLLARLRLLHDQTRIVALSATVENADEVAEWLGADKLSSNWRPTVLTQQIIEYEQGETFAETEAIKDRVVSDLVRDARADERDPANVLVFCGSRKAVETTACLLAGVKHPGDPGRAQQLCNAAGVGFHYRGAPHAEQTVRSFQDRTLNTVVATSTLSTGVNTPARVVIVRDTTLGVTPLEVSQAQQMFGRAGRAGKEKEGYAFLLAPAGEAAAWRTDLEAGYWVESRIEPALSDAVLAEVLLGNIASKQDAEDWFQQTFAYWQGRREIAPIRAALETLELGGMVAFEDEGRLDVTEVGRLTSRLMVDVPSAAKLLRGLNAWPLPRTAEDAEEVVLGSVANAVKALKERQINEARWEDTVADLLGKVSVRAHEGSVSSKLTVAAALLALRQPEVLSRSRIGGGLHVSDLRAALEDLPRYLAWVAALGPIGAADWQAIVAGDVARRLTYHRLAPQPSRGAGRLLWLLERMCEPEDRAQFVKGLWPHASNRFSVPEEMDRPPDQWGGYVPGSYETATDERTTIKVSECRPTAEGLEISLSWTGTPARAVVWTHSATGSARSEAAKAIPPVFTVRESEATAATGRWPWRRSSSPETVTTATTTQPSRQRHVSSEPGGSSSRYPPALSSCRGDASGHGFRMNVGRCGR